MSLKKTAVAVAALAVAATYVHHFHPDLIMKFRNSQKNAFESAIRAFKEGEIYSSIRHGVSKLTSQSSSSGDNLFTVEELSRYNGHESSQGLYLSILGKVYDVQKGRKHYGPGGSYHGFVGRDASRAFVTGDFSDKGLTDDVIGLSPQDLLSIQEWSQFYHKDYEYKGKLIGRFYTTEGERTDYFKKVDELMKQGSKQNEAKKAEHTKYPPCNVEWSQETGSRVWCSNKSGGIERDWVGVPRKLYMPGSDSFRCACIKLSADATETVPHQTRKGNLEEYENCPYESISCYVSS